MSEVILKTNIVREKGYIYFTSTDEKGNITLCRAVSGRKKKEAK